MTRLTLVLGAVLGISACPAGGNPDARGSDAARDAGARDDHRPLEVEALAVLAHRVDHPPRELGIEDEGDDHEDHEVAEAEAGRIRAHAGGV